MDSVLKATLASALMAGLGWLLLQLASRPAGTTEGTSAGILRHSWAVKSMGWVLGILPAIAVGLYGSTVVAVAIVAGLTAFGLYCINESRAEVHLTEFGMDAFSPWRGRTTIEWYAVESVRYNTYAQWFVVRDRSRNVIRISRYMVGIPTLRDRLEERLDPGIYARAIVGFEGLDAQH